MCGLTGKSEEEIAEDLSGVIFLNPFYSEGSSEPKYIPADEYLSGNVREKLAVAKTAAESDTAFEVNVRALSEVMPKDLTASEISVRLGATWLPPEDVEQFMFELFSTARYISWNIHVHYSEYTGEWNIEGKSYDRGNIKVYNTYGTSRINGYKIIEETLNLRDVRIFDYVEDENGNKKPVLNKKETAIAQGKQQLIKDAFADWIWKDQERRDRLCKLYNEKFNSVRPREYNGEHLNFVGINPEITLRPHQVNAIAHILYGGNTLLAHVVGAGKTFEMVAAAQESMSLFKETADIQTADMLNLPVPKANYHNVVLKPSEQQKEMVKSLSERAEKVRNKMVDSSVDNMLLITNDGRKLALDQRMINEMLPDSETSKVSACADNVFDIWQKTADERSTQMVFCDLSTPHGDGSFNVYDDLRDKLIAKGVPKEEIAYIHSASTEMQKKELFGKVRSGQVRVLIGSTQKMGAGTNVQKKLIALHHLDCPWRPSDLQQREGRIIRQGNDNPEVEIFTYVTENTFDSYLYQLVESKQKFIGQIMTSKSPVRSAEDVDEQALSYAEIKALCTGNPYIKEKMDLDIDVSRLKLLKANHLSQIYSLEDKIHKEFPQKIAALEERIKGYDKDIATAESHPVGDKDSFCGMDIKGLTFTDKKEAGEAIIAACKAMTNPDPIRIGCYRGFEMELSFDTFSKEYKIVLIGELRHTVVLGTDIFGNVLRLDNAIGAMPERQIACKEQLEDTKVQLENAKVESQKPFPHEEELKTKSARLAELNTLLDMDKKDNEIVDSERSEEAEEPDRADSRDAR